MRNQKNCPICDEKMNNLKLKSELFAKKNFFQSNKLIDSIKFLIEKT